jgi:hypothetical protein
VGRLQSSITLLIQQFFKKSKDEIGVFHFTVVITTEPKKTVMTKLKWLMLLLFLTNLSATAQEITQTIRGTIIDQDTRSTLPGANIVVLNSDPVLGTVTDIDGNFRIDNVAIGRVTLKISFIGYEDKTLPNILVGSGKEIVLNIELVESIKKLDDVVITATKNKTEVLNEMAVISARSFSVEETKRYAGAIDDPARMVSSFAGVNGNAEGNNDIVVRGNSPRGILWRLEGIEIPNPNHFAQEGATGGPINALNSAMLGNSDFFTGAFAPEYGNALSGVFDMKLRNGNNEKREYSATASILGTDLTIEGPFKSGYSGSYLANYRYSTLSILDETGIVDFGGVPKYQDGSFKLVLPAGDKSIFSLFGLGGISSIAQEETDPENEDRILWRAGGGAKLGILGLSHTYLLNDKAYLKTTLSATTTEQNSFYDIPDGQDVLYNVSNSDITKTSLNGTTALNYKLNARNKFKTGVIFSRLGYDLNDNYWNFTTDQLEPTLSKSGNSGTLQGYLSWKYRLSEKVSMVTGLHYLHFMLNNSNSIEPRWALKWQQNETQAYTLGFGMHSKLESMATYLGEQLQPDGSFTNPNTELGLSKALHVVFGYDKLLTANTRLKAEAYYQHLYNVPIENATNSTYSLLNSSEWFTTRTLSNDGTGTNYGVELTLERFFNKGFYYMSTLSLYRSFYTPKDGVEYQSAFDGNYVFNLLGGKEFSVGKAEKNKTLFINTKLAYIGGARYTPIDLDASIALGDAVRNESNPFSAKGDDVLKLDLAIGLRRNKKRTTTEFKIDIQNVTNNAAIVNEYYDHATESIVISNQLPLLPVISYKINF